MDEVESRRVKGVRKTAGVLRAQALLCLTSLGPAMDTWRGTLRHDRLTHVVDHGGADGANAGSFAVVLVPTVRTKVNTGGEGDAAMAASTRFGNAFRLKSQTDQSLTSS